MLFFYVSILDFVYRVFDVARGARGAWPIAGMRGNVGSGIGFFDLNFVLARLEYLLGVVHWNAMYSFIDSVYVQLYPSSEWTRRKMGF
jgi:hypothetical protein